MLSNQISSKHPTYQQVVLSNL